MRNARLVCHWSFIAGLAVTLATLAPPARAAIIPRSTEISMGREAAQEFERSAILNNDAFLTSKIRRIGARLVSVCDEPGYPYEFHFVDSGVVNAFALPGGFIYMYRGLVQLLPNDDALAFVMAHEISHVTRRHSVRQLEKSLIINTVLNAIVPSNTGIQVLETILGSHFSRTDETDADTRGLTMMARAGFDPTQGAEAMKVIRRAAGSGRGIPKLIRSHPLPDDRIARLNKQAAQIKAEYARLAPPPDPAAPTPAERLAALPTTTIQGLDGVEVATSLYFPLKTGARWRYRTSGEGAVGQTILTVLEMVPGSPRGVYRVELNLGRNVTAVQWIAPTRNRILRREASGNGWKTEFAFPTLPGEGDTAVTLANSSGGAPPGTDPVPASAASIPSFRAVARETVQVPAGEFTALKVETLSPTGEVVTTCWFAPGVGLVKRVSLKTGLTQELESLHMPTDVPAPPAPQTPPPPLVATGDTAMGEEQATAGSTPMGEAGAPEEPERQP
jgi:Zn-dependent protease with chaperone function